MFNSVLRGIATSASELTSSVTNASSAITDIVGAYTSGEDVNKKDVIKLLEAGFDVVQIATFFGVAENIIKELAEDY